MLIELKKEIPTQLIIDLAESKKRVKEKKLGLLTIEQKNGSC
jgi:hypothetical protein